MSVDWTKYPPLPEPPVLPPYRDTPEREAYWKELTDFEPIPRFGYIIFAAGLIAFGAGGAFLAWGTAYSSLGNWLCAAGSMILIVFLLAFFTRYLCWRIGIFTQEKVKSARGMRYSHCPPILLPLFPSTQRSEKF